MSFVPKISAGQAASNRIDLCEALGIRACALDAAIERASDSSDPLFGNVLAACAAQDNDTHPTTAQERARIMIANGDADAIVRISGIGRISDVPCPAPSSLFEQERYTAYPYCEHPEASATRIFLVFRDRDLSSEPRRVLYGGLGEYLDRLALSGCSAEEVETILDDILKDGRHVGFGLVGTTMEIVGLPRIPEPEDAPPYLMQPA